MRCANACQGSAGAEVEEAGEHEGMGGAGEQLRERDARAKQRRRQQPERNPAFHGPSVLRAGSRGDRQGDHSAPWRARAQRA